MLSLSYKGEGVPYSILQSEVERFTLLNHHLDLESGNLNRSHEFLLLDDLPILQMGKLVPELLHSVLKHNVAHHGLKPVPVALHLLKLLSNVGLDRSDVLSLVSVGLSLLQILLVQQLLASPDSLSSQGIILSSVSLLVGLEVIPNLDVLDVAADEVPMVQFIVLRLLQLMGVHLGYELPSPGFVVDHLLYLHAKPVLMLSGVSRSSV